MARPGRRTRGEMLQAQARDVLGRTDLHETAKSLTGLAEAVIEVALGAVAGLAHRVRRTHRWRGWPWWPWAVSGGRAGLCQRPRRPARLRRRPAARRGGRAPTPRRFLKLMNGQTPVQRLYDLDLSLRPEGRKGFSGPEPQGFRGLLRPLGPGLGTPGPDPRARRRRRPGGGVTLRRDRPPFRLGQRAVRGRRQGDPPHEGPGRARTRARR